MLLLACLFVGIGLVTAQTQKVTGVVISEEDGQPVIGAYLDRKKKYFSTKVYLKPEQWVAKKLVVKKHPNADALNRLIYEFVAAIEKKELELWQQGKRISLELLKDALATRENNSSFISSWKHISGFQYILY